jgi:hypothetical protein
MRLDAPDQLGVRQRQTDLLGDLPYGCIACGLAELDVAAEQPVEASTR